MNAWEAIDHFLDKYIILPEYTSENFVIQVAFLFN
jgi:hypothetical protein